MPLDNSSDLRSAIERNTEILEQNNKILRKLHSYEVWSFWTRLIWYALLVGLPFALYYYILAPYFEALGSSYETFSAGIGEIPGLKQWSEVLSTYKGE